MHRHKFSVVRKTLVLRDSVVPERLGGTWVAQIPSGPEACRLEAVESLTPTTTPRRAQNELHSPHSISERSLQMNVFHGNNAEMGKQ